MKRKFKVFYREIMPCIRYVMHIESTIVEQNTLTNYIGCLRIYTYLNKFGCITKQLCMDIIRSRNRGILFRGIVGKISLNS